MADADESFYNKIITRDEAWCFAYDPRTKQQSSESVGETSPPPKKPKFQRSCIKTMFIIFFDSEGAVHKEFVPGGKTVNAKFYNGVMGHLLKHIQRVHPSAFCSFEIFSCCVIMCPPTKLQAFAFFDPK